ncbi:origin of replication complex subunit 6-like [Trifolium pratense]|uniref:origin of replication complex subunit 6-like n=1 Tax=Trifolium pratense TaxID=57577 RepID=UPI001E697839|nr:origin of replication complex subunit 6-like [Trifolium pratense]
MDEVVRTLEKLQVPNLNVGNLKHADGQSPNLLAIDEKRWPRFFFCHHYAKQSPVFMAVAFYICAKKHKLKVDKIKLIELCGTSEAEFSSVSTTMKDLCHDVFGVAKEKKDPKEVKTNRDLLDVLPSKRKAEDGGYLSMMEQRHPILDSKD